MTEKERDMTYKLASFFAGVGGIDTGFEQGGDFAVSYANEFDKNAQTTYATNFGDAVLERADIRTINPESGQFAEADVDVLSAGYPCQPFSIGGYRRGLADPRGDLFFEALRMIKAKQPQAVFLENVKNLVSHDRGNSFKVMREYLAHAGYYMKWQVMNATEYGNIRQNRERIYVVAFKDKTAYENFEFPEKITLTNQLSDLIDFGAKVDEKYYYRANKQKFYPELAKGVTSQDTVYQWRRQYVRENKSGVVPTLTANMGTGGHNVPLILTDSGEIRKLTPREVFNIDGYPSDYVFPDKMSNASLYKQAGNSVVVPVIARIASQIETALGQAVTNGPLPTSDGKFLLIKLTMANRLAGTSEIVSYGDTKSELEKLLPENGVLYDDDMFFEAIRKGKTAEFYMIVG